MLIDVCKVRGKRVKVALRNRIVFMIVAATAFESQPQERGSGRDRSIGDVDLTELLLDAASFIGLSMETIEGRR